MSNKKADAGLAEILNSVICFLVRASPHLEFFNKPNPE